MEMSGMDKPRVTAKAEAALAQRPNSERPGLSGTPVQSFWDAWSPRLDQPSGGQDMKPCQWARALGLTLV